MMMGRQGGLMEATCTSFPSAKIFYCHLDDIITNANRSIWESMEKDFLEISSSRGSKMMVLTRCQEVAEMMTASVCYRLDELISGLLYSKKDDDEWSRIGATWVSASDTDVIEEAIRYLDVSRTSIHTFPDSITKLYNLKTSRVDNLKKLPEKFINLKNLRHVYGYLQIPNIGKRRDESREEASRSNLSRKFGISILELHWDLYMKCKCNNNELLEVLKSHSNLTDLSITGFSGHTFPSWIKLQSCDLSGSKSLDDIVSKPGWSSTPHNAESLKQIGGLDYFPWQILFHFQNLEFLKLIGWSRLKSLPDLQRLPALRELIIENFNMLGSSLNGWRFGC
ncbi:hypothetical protein Leryth_020852 [Lithospermum erythrorhizon]|nr:hypothetical protein Leryth_020852 [Lithospermum erythrorhizon]